MRTPRSAAIAATFSLVAVLAVTDLPSGPGESSAHTRAASTPSADLAALRNCESGGDYAANTGNGYYGADQFSASTWQSLGYGGHASNAAPEVQDEAALRLASTEGWGQWPSCARQLGLSGKAAPPPPPVTPVVAAPPAPASAPAPLGGRKAGREFIRWARSAPPVG